VAIVATFVKSGLSTSIPTYRVEPMTESAAGADTSHTPTGPSVNNQAVPTSIDTNSRNFLSYLGFHT